LNIDLVPIYPAAYTNDNVVTTAATDAQDQLAGFSDYGTNAVDLASPGVDLMSTVPAHLARTSRLFTASSNYAPVIVEYSGTTTGITATAYDCGLGYTTSFPAAVRSNIALIRRGDLFFYEKVSNAMASGAVAAIIFNSVTGALQPTLSAPDTNWIPTVFISMAEGTQLLAQAPAAITLAVKPDPLNPYAFGQGTSFAAPHLSAAVALMALAFPSESVTQRIARILSHVEVIPALTNKVKSRGRLDLAACLDTDGDQLGDWWELQYTNSLTVLNGTGDADGDGISNVREFAAGSHPFSATSFFQFANSGSATGGQLTLRWPSVAGKDYRIHTAPQVTGTWSSASSLISATPPQNTATVQTTNDIGIFRIEVE
jgi:subtilisin family serine protease